jgi:hypothetical protein
VRWSILDAVSPARRAVSPLLVALTLLLALGSAACGGGSASDTASGPAARTGEDSEDDEDEGGTTADQRGDRGKGGSGWRWRGSRSECFYRHRNRCFTELQAACRAAKCDESRCKHSESVPSVVTCAR